MGVASAVYSEATAVYEPATGGGGGVPTTRVLTAGAGLTGGGDLSADRTFTVAAADGTIQVNADSIEATGAFGNKNVTTTGYITIGSSVASFGYLRVSNNVIALAAHAAGAGSIALLGTDAADGVQVGDATNAVTLVVQAAGDITIKRGAATKVTVGSALVTLADGVIEMGASGPRILKGTGSPEGVVTAVVGSVYQRDNGGASTTLYVKESGSGNTGWVAYGAGGAGAGVGLYSAIPAAGTAGKQYFTTDGTRMLVDDGAAWRPFINGTLGTLPAAAANWTWVNQSTATATDIGGAVYLASPSNATDSVRMLTATLSPAQNYTFRAHVRPILYPANYTTASIILRDSVGAKFVALAIMRVGGDNQHIQVQKWTSATAFSASYVDLEVPFLGDGIWLQFRDSGGNRIAEWSYDGKNFVQIHSIVRTDWCTPDTYGFGVNPLTGAVGLTIDSSSQA